jgi:hypothetical protein
MYYHSAFKEASPAQLQTLRQMGVQTEGSISSHEADQLIKRNKARWESLPPTDKQAFVLRQRGRWRDGMTRGEATELIERLKTGEESEPWERPSWWPKGRSEGE